MGCFCSLFFFLFRPSQCPHSPPCRYPVAMRTRIRKRVYRCSRRSGACQRLRPPRVNLNDIIRLSPIATCSRSLPTLPRWAPGSSHSQKSITGEAMISPGPFLHDGGRHKDRVRLRHVPVRVVQAARFHAQVPRVDRHARDVVVVGAAVARLGAPLPLTGNVGGVEGSRVVAAGRREHGARGGGLCGGWRADGSGWGKRHVWCCRSGVRCLLGPPVAARTGNGRIDVRSDHWAQMGTRLQAWAKDSRAVPVQKRNAATLVISAAINGDIPF